MCMQSHSQGTPDPVSAEYLFFSGLVQQAKSHNFTHISDLIMFYYIMYIGLGVTA